MKRFNDTGTTVSNPKFGRKRTVCTQALVDVVRKRISRNPRRNVRELAMTLGVAGTTMRSCSWPFRDKFVQNSTSSVHLSTFPWKTASEMQKIGSKNVKRRWKCLYVVWWENIHGAGRDRFLAKSIASIAPGARITFRCMKLASMMVWAEREDSVYQREN